MPRLRDRSYATNNGNAVAINNTHAVNNPTSRTASPIVGGQPTQPQTFVPNAVSVASFGVGGSFATTASGAPLVRVSAEGGGSGGEPGPGPLTLLRRDWRMASISQFCHLFALTLGLQGWFDVEKLEMDLCGCKPDSFAPELVSRLLSTLSSDRTVTPSNFQYRLRREYHRRALAEDKLLFGDPNWEKELEKQERERERERERLRALEDEGPEVKEDAMEVDGEEEKGTSSVVATESKDDVGAPGKGDDGEIKERDEIKEKRRPKLWSDIGMDDKVRALYNLCEWHVSDGERWRKFVERKGVAEEMAEEGWRIEPIGYDSKSNIYYLFDDNRLWVQRSPPKPPKPPKQPKSNARPKASTVGSPAKGKKVNQSQRAIDAAKKAKEEGRRWGRPPTSGKKEKGKGDAGEAEDEEEEDLTPLESSDEEEEAVGRSKRARKSAGANGRESGGRPKRAAAKAASKSINHQAKLQLEFIRSQQQEQRTPGPSSISASASHGPKYRDSLGSPRKDSSPWKKPRLIGVRSSRRLRGPPGEDEEDEGWQEIPPELLLETPEPESSTTKPEQSNSKSVEPSQSPSSASRGKKRKRDSNVLSVPQRSTRTTRRRSAGGVGAGPGEEDEGEWQQIPEEWLMTPEELAVKGKKKETGGSAEEAVEAEEAEETQAKTQAEEGETNEGVPEEGVGAEPEMKADEGSGVGKGPDSEILAEPSNVIPPVAEGKRAEETSLQAPDEQIISRVNGTSLQTADAVDPSSTNGIVNSISESGAGDGDMGTTKTLDMDDDMVDEDADGERDGDVVEQSEQVTMDDSMDKGPKEELDTDEHQMANGDHQQEQAPKEEPNLPLKDEKVTVPSLPGFIEWECLCVTLAEWEAFPHTLIDEKHPDERALKRYLLEDVLPQLEPVLVAKEKARKKVEMIELGAIKRSSRLAYKESQEEERRRHEATQKEEEARLEALARAEARNQHLVNEARIKQRAQEEAQQQSREARLREREDKKREREERAAFDALEREKREREREMRKAEGAKRKGKAKDKANKRREENEDVREPEESGEEWALDCEVCGRRGRNLDEGDKIICCDRCDVWQHMACHDQADVRAGRPERNWEAADFVCSYCRTGRARPPIPLGEPGPPPAKARAKPKPSSAKPKSPTAKANPHSPRSPSTSKSPKSHSKPIQRKPSSGAGADGHRQHPQYPAPPMQGHMPGMSNAHPNLYSRMYQHQPQQMVYPNINPNFQYTQGLTAGYPPSPQYQHQQFVGPSYPYPPNSVPNGYAVNQLQAGAFANRPQQVYPLQHPYQGPGPSPLLPSRSPPSYPARSPLLPSFSPSVMHSPVTSATSPPMGYVSASMPSPPPHVRQSPQAAYAQLPLYSPPPPHALHVNGHQSSMARPFVNGASGDGSYRA